MQSILTIIARMHEKGDEAALFWNNQEYPYSDFMDMVGLAIVGAGFGQVTFDKYMKGE